MVFIYSRFFALFLALSPSVISLPFSHAQEQVFSSAGEVFISFAKENLGESWGQEMGVSWESRIIKNTTAWGVEEAQNFLDYMVKRVGIEHTVKRIKSPSYFKGMRYASFKERVKLYEEYLGVSEVTYRLQRSLGGFHVGNMGEIRDFIKYITKYLGGGEEAEESIRQMMKSSLYAFSRAKTGEVKKFVKYMEEYMGGGEEAKESIRQMMKNNLQAFSRAKTGEVKKFVEYVEEYMGGGEEAEESIRQMMKSSLQAFSNAKTGKVKEFVEYVEKYMGGGEEAKESIRQMMKKQSSCFL